MHITAIYNLPDNKDDLAEPLAAALGTTVYEARSRLRIPGKGPLVAASCRDREAAEKITREIKTEEREGFFNLYAGSLPTLVFRESSLIYDSPGFALKPSRAANFAYLISELRQRQSEAVYDERLLRRPAQAALLGPLLSPEEFLHVAASLLANILRPQAG